MQKTAGYKIKLFLALAIAAVVVCTLPFLAFGKAVINVYPANATPNAAEKALISALRQEGYKVKISSASSNDIALWFRSPAEVNKVANHPAIYNFMYTDAHYPFAWQKMKRLPIILTPHQDLYEHYARSNIKAAVFPEISVTTAKPAAARLKALINWLNKTRTN